MVSLAQGDKDKLHIYFSVSLKKPAVMAISWQVFPEECVFITGIQLLQCVYLKNIHEIIFKKEVLLDLPGKIPEMQM